MRLNDLTAPIYLDYAASTPVDAAVVQVMHETLLSSHANPSAKSHRYGWQADQLVQSARADIAETLNCYSRELLFTSGATEADNIALQGVLRACLMVLYPRFVPKVGTWSSPAGCCRNFSTSSSGGGHSGLHAMCNGT